MTTPVRATALGVSWLAGVTGAVMMVDHGQENEKDELVERFVSRTQTNATFVSAYVDDLFLVERRMAADLRTGPVNDATLGRSARVAGFTVAVLLDGDGRVRAVTPSDHGTHGLDLAQRYAHLASALDGKRMVSGVVPSAVTGEAVVAFALPLGHGRDGVISSGFNLRDSPLTEFLGTAPYAGVQGYIIDAAGVPALYAGDGATEDISGTDLEMAADGAIGSDGRLSVSARIEGTPWRLLMSAPLASVTAPAASNDALAWRLLGTVALLILIGLVVLERTANARARMARARAEADERFRLTVQNAPIGMTMVGLDGTLIEPNARLCRLLGYTAEELQRLKFFEVTHPDDVERQLGFHEQLRAGEIPHYEMEKRYLRADGGDVWARVSVSVVRDSQGKPLHFVHQMEDVTEIRTAQEKLERRALYDPLTGLANRGLLLDRLTHALTRRRRGKELVAVAFCDLDHFKRVNDSLGHQSGDVMLREVARRLQDAVRTSDTVARMGGDEFVLLLPDVDSLAGAQVVVDRARLAVEQPIEVDGHSLVVKLSAGLAVGTSGAGAEMLLRDADTALYTAKEGGRARCEVYTSAMRSRALMHLSIESELRVAIEEDQFELYYQPIIEMSTRKTVAFEALLRWHHPTRGLLLPGDFLEVAEETQLTIQLGDLVLRHACAFLARHPTATWRVFVNISPVALGRNLDGVIAAALDVAGVSPLRLGIEITENSVLSAIGSSLKEMEALRDMGVDMLMDDFGTGYSALSSVLSTPISGLKLDQSFTCRLGDGGNADRITAAVSDLVRNLSLLGVVEGVETEDQWRRACEHGWMYGQGFLFARPAPASQLTLPTPKTTMTPPAVLLESSAARS
ncbi:MAG TPA: EAL domain-containing protein [Nocardioidaceae bacterium]|nr:EAL domain-containing protein [Nocardioidaceae bacterium]